MQQREVKLIYFHLFCLQGDEKHTKTWRHTKNADLQRSTSKTQKTQTSPVFACGTLWLHSPRELIIVLLLKGETLSVELGTSGINWTVNSSHRGTSSHNRNLLKHPTLIKYKHPWFKIDQTIVSGRFLVSLILTDHQTISRSYSAPPGICDANSTSLGEFCQTLSNHHFGTDLTNDWRPWETPKFSTKMRVKATRSVIKVIKHVSTIKLTWSWDTKTQTHQYDRLTWNSSHWLTPYWFYFMW